MTIPVSPRMAQRADVPLESIPDPDQDVDMGYTAHSDAPRMSPTPQSVFSSPTAPSAGPMSLPVDNNHAPKAPAPAKKKGTAKNVTGRSKAKAASASAKAKGTTKKSKPAASSTTKGGGSSAVEESSAEESDSGPYCICRGPDDHRWMICCERCEEWFHGECLKIDKYVGEHLIEKFICPSCAESSSYVTRYKKICSLDGCNKPARIYNVAESEASVFCSDEHTSAWWDRIIHSLPRRASLAGSRRDELTQEDFVGILVADPSRREPQAPPWELVRHPLDRREAATDITNGMGDLSPSGDHYLNSEERIIVEASAADRRMLGEEIVLCKQMLHLLELAFNRRKAAIATGHFSEDICGYDNRLDSVSAKHQFAAFLETEQAVAIFMSDTLSSPDGSADPDAVAVRGMCDRKRCKVHSGWHNILARAVRAQIKELAAEAATKRAAEDLVRQSSRQRYFRKKLEKNYVENVRTVMVDGKATYVFERVGGSRDTDMKG